MERSIKKHARKQPERGTDRRAGKESPAEWDRTADWYDGLVGREGSEYHREIVLPGAYRLLAPEPGDSVLDIGCGQGVFCRYLSERSVRATGIDASSKLIALARKMKKRTAMESYQILDSSHMEGLPDDAFDAAVTILAVQNMPDPAAVARETLRVVKRGGKLLWVLVHPCFRTPRQSSWGYDETKKLQYRRVDLYLSPLAIPIQTHPGKRPDLVTHTYHRPLSDFINALGENGWYVVRTEEWASHKTSQPGPRAKAENRARSEFPLFLAILAENGKRG